MPMSSDGITSSNGPSLPGGVMLSRIKVYDTESSDGQSGGTPHLHLACSETYVLTAGRGAVELIDPAGFRRVSLERDRLLGFAPGTIHRLVNLDSNLEVLVIMQNAGLPELGDAVMTFPNDTLADATRYREAATANTLEQARCRRDLGVHGFSSLREAFNRSLKDGRSALDTLYRHALERVNEHLLKWGAVVREGPLREAECSLERIASLRAGRYDAVIDAHAWELFGHSVPVLGMCGQITRFECAPG